MNKIKVILFRILTILLIIVAIPFILLYVCLACLWIIFFILSNIIEDFVKRHIDKHDELYPLWVKKIFSRLSNFF